MRPDCVFVYFTHDLEFAASRSNAKKIVLYGFDGKAWTWSEVPEEEAIPEDIMLALVGSRKPILFTEGNRPGLDAEVYSYIYPGYSVVAVGSCESVIYAAASFSRLKRLHNLDCKGLIDQDQRTEKECAQLLHCGVYTNGVSEIENLLLKEEVLRAVASARGENDADSIVVAIKELVFNRLKADRDRLSNPCSEGFSKIISNRLAVEDLRTSL